MLLKNQNKPGAIIIEGHVQGLSNTRALGELGIPVIVLDKYNCIARYSKYCTKYFKSPDYISNDFIDFLLELGKKERLDGWTLIPSNDHIVYNLSRNKKRISDIYKTIVPDFDNLMNLYDKYKFLSLNQEEGIPVPGTILANNIDSINSLKFPVLIKGREGLSFFKSTGKKGIVAQDPENLNKIVSQLIVKTELDKIIIQELIPFNDSSDVWSFCGFAINGDIKSYWIGKKLREHPSKFGTATLAMSDYNENIEKYGKSVIKALNYTGVCEIEFVRDTSDKSFKLIEMNPRTWLWVDLARYCGIDFTKYIYFYLNKISIDYPKDYKKNVKWMNFWTDMFFSIKSILRKDLKIKKYLLQNKGELIQAVYKKNDNLPFLMMTIMLIYLARKRSRFQY